MITDLKITIIVATFNADRTVKRCINSIFFQSYPHKELIVMDGVSSDSTVQILKDLKKLGRIDYLVSEKDTGIYQAWNKALKVATGDWICFLGADDFFWSKNVLEQMAIHLARAYPLYSVVYGPVNNVSSQGEIFEKVGTPWNLAKEKFSHELTIPHQGTFHHKSIFEKNGLFDESFRITGDYDLLLRHLKTNDALFVDSITVTGMQFGGLSSQLSTTFVNIRELNRARKNNGFWCPSVYLLWREFRARVRRFLNFVVGEKFSNILADVYRIVSGKARIWTRRR